jgi:hypothetical protein
MAGGGIVGFAGPQGSYVGANNPLNLRDYNQNWDGQAGATRGFVDFEDEYSGVRAADKLLSNYGAEEGIDTLRGIISRFAPPGENATEDYISFVSEQTGIPSEQLIDLADEGTRRRILSAMAKMESGQDIDVARVMSSREPDREGTSVTDQLLAAEQRRIESNPTDEERAQGDKYNPVAYQQRLREQDMGRRDPNYGREEGNDAQLRRVSMEDVMRDPENTAGVGSLARYLPSGEGVGETLRRLLGLTNAKDATLSVPENDAGLSALSPQQVEAEAEIDLLNAAQRRADEAERNRLMAEGMLGEEVMAEANVPQSYDPFDPTNERFRQAAMMDSPAQDDSGGMLNSIRETLMNQLNLGATQPDTGTFTDAAGTAYPMEELNRVPTDEEKLQSLFPGLDARRNAAEQADADAEINLLNAAQARSDDNRARWEDLITPKRQSEESNQAPTLADAIAAMMEQTSQDEAAQRNTVMEGTTVPTPADLDNRERLDLQGEISALREQQREYPPYGESKVIYDALQTKISAMTKEVNAMQQRDTGGRQRTAEREYGEQENTNRILAELGLTGSSEIANPYGTVNETEQVITPAGNGVTEQTIIPTSNAGALTDEENNMALTQIARAIGGTDEQIDNARTNASERFTVKGSNAPSTTGSGGISSVQDRYDQLTTPQSGSEAFFDLLKTLGGGAGRSKGFEFAGIAQEGAARRAVESKEALDIIGAENRAAAVAAQNQTDQRTFVANYQQANAGRGTPEQLYIEGAQLYMTANSIYRGNTSKFSEFTELVKDILEQPMNPLTRQYNQAVRSEGVESQEAKDSFAQIMTQAQTLFNAAKTVTEES